MPRISPLLALHRTLVFLLQPWRVSGDTARRLGLLLIVIFIWDAVLAIDGQVQNLAMTTMLVVTIVIYPLLAFVCALLTRQSPLPRFLAWPAERYLQVVPIILLVAVTAICFQLPSILNSKAQIADDVTPSTICAARDVLHGQDPYLLPELACLNSLHASPDLGTPLQRGTFAGLRSYPSSEQLQQLAHRVAAADGRTSAFAVFGYPPMSFVWMLPAALGNHSAWVAYTMLMALIWLLLIALAAGSLWPIAALLMLLQFGDGSILGAATQGDGEFFAYAAMTLALIVIDRRRLSAVAIGLAMATNPLAWVLAAGYLIYTSTLPKFKERSLWLALTLIVTFAPWIIIEHQALSSMIALITQPTFAFGIGIVNIFMPTPAPILRHLLMLLTVAAALTTTAFAWHRRSWLSILPVLSVAFLWLSWRSDANYLVQLFPLTVALIIGLHRLRQSQAIDPPISPASPPPNLAPSQRLNH